MQYLITKTFTNDLVFYGQLIPHQLSQFALLKTIQKFYNWLFLFSLSSIFVTLFVSFRVVLTKAPGQMTRSLHRYIATSPEETVTRYEHIFFRSLPETPKYVFVSYLLNPCKLSYLDSSVGFYLVQISQLLVWKKFPGVFVTFISYLYCNSMEAEILFPVRLEILVKRFTHRYSLP